METGNWSNRKEAERVDKFKAESGKAETEPQIFTEVKS